MLLHESRRAARSTPEGELVLLDDQDRSAWDRELIAEGCGLVERALRSRRFGRTRCKPRSPPCTRKRRTRRRRTGHRSWGSTTCWRASSRRPWSSSTARWPSRCATVRRRASRGWTRCSRAARSPTTRRRTSCAPTCAASSASSRAARAAYERALELTRQAPSRRFLERALLELADDGADAT
jgi:RNA polymerase sigma-70 factor (ECF subfamily)